MIGHAYVAVGALDDVAAAAAGDKCRIAAPVDEKNRLMPAFQAALHSLHQRAAENGMIPHLQLLPHVHEVHLGHRAIVHARRQFQQRQIAPLRERKGTHARRRAREQQRPPFVFAAHACNLSRVVTRRIVGDVALFMLLVHDHDAQVFKRREDRGSGADDDARVALANAPPLVEPLPRR